MVKEKESVTMEEREVRELNIFLDYELHTTFIGWETTMIIAATILAAAQLEFTDDSVFIYRLFRVFVLSIVMCAILTLRCLGIMLVRLLFRCGRFRIFRMGRRIHCSNYRRRDLKNKRCFVLHILFFRYAFRVEDT